MSGTINAHIQLGYKSAAWFTANPTLVLKVGQRVDLEQTGTYKLGDGTTQLSALSFLGGGGGGGQVDSVTGTANRIAITGTAVDPIINIDSQYDTAVTNAIAAAVAGLANTCMMIHSPNTWFSPANGQYYYFGMQNLAATNSVANTATNVREVGAPCTGAIIAAVISIRLDNGGTVSGQASTLFLRNTTAGTFTQVTNSFTYVAPGTPSFKSVVVTGLNIPVTQGDLCMSVIGNPTFTVNPSTVYFRIDYLIQT
jgi:hypothetical protein